MVSNYTFHTLITNIAEKHLMLKNKYTAPAACSRPVVTKKYKKIFEARVGVSYHCSCTNVC